MNEKTIRVAMGAVARVVLLITFSFFGELLAQELYRWVDDKGIIHFADSLHSVPETYRRQAEKRFRAPSTDFPAAIRQSESELSEEPAP